MQQGIGDGCAGKTLSKTVCLLTISSGRAGGGLAIPPSDRQGKASHLAILVRGDAFPCLSHLATDKERHHHELRLQGESYH